MAKIIRVENDVVMIGNDDGSIQQVRRTDLSFEPHLNDEVNVFSNETQIIVTKKENTMQNSMANGGININLQNVNNAGMSNGMVYQSGAVVNKVLFLVITFFLGGLGIQKFLIGKVGAGILSILFFWTCIPAIIAIIDFIVACCKQADANGNIVM